VKSQTDSESLASMEAAIEILDGYISNPTHGLPDPIFYFVSRLTPLVNVDLLIKDEKGRTLLAMRNDPYAGKGWHVPGGIVRFKETLETRIEKVALTEIGVPVQYDPTPIAINQLIHRDRNVRGHFLSLLYRCFLPSDFVPPNHGLTVDDAGYLMWHDRCPDNLIVYHEIYRNLIGARENSP